MGDPEDPQQAICSNHHVLCAVQHADICNCSDSLRPVWAGAEYLRELGSASWTPGRDGVGGNLRNWGQLLQEQGSKDVKVSAGRWTAILHTDSLLLRRCYTDAVLSQICNPFRHLQLFRM